MQLGIDLGAARTRFCLASALLGAGPGSWSLANNRTWEEPSWLCLKLGLTPDGTRGVLESLIGRGAMEAASNPLLRRALDLGDAVIWPRFPREIEQNLEAFEDALLLFWEHAVTQGIRKRHPNLKTAVLTSPLSKERRLAEAVKRVPEDLRLITLPDFYCAYLAAGSTADAKERLLYVDPGDEAFRLTRFRVFRDGDETFVWVEEVEEHFQLGFQLVASGPIGSHLHRERGEQFTDLDIWLQLEASSTGGGGLSSALANALANAGETMRRRLQESLERAKKRDLKVDRLLIREDCLWLLHGAFSDKLPAIVTIGPHGTAQGAALFGQPWATPAHFIFPGGLYVSVNSSEPELLVGHESILNAQPAGTSFGLEVSRGAWDDVDLTLLWGPEEGWGTFFPLAHLGVSLAGPSSKVVVGVTVHHTGADVYGTAWIADPSTALPPSTEWSLDLNRWAYWSVR